MMKFVTLSSMFVGNSTLLIVYVASGQGGLVMLPLVGATVTGCALVRMLVMPLQRPSIYED